MATATRADQDPIASVRAFNREYTRLAGLLTDDLLDTPHTLTEARVLFELDETSELSMLELRARMGLDPGYTSRLVSRLGRRGLIRKRRSEDDGRVQLLGLTATGAEQRALLDRRSAEQVGALLEPIPEDRRDALLGAMRTVTDVLGMGTAGDEVTVRGLEGGDIGWILQRHGVLFPQEFGWGPGFEALIAEVLADFAPRREEPVSSGWIAELDGRRVGSILCVGIDERTAKLRLLLVEPEARGRGVGTILVEECIAFARSAGYAELVLWTMDVLVDARRIYERAGFELVDSERHRRFGPELVGQTWKLDFGTAAG